MSQRAAIRMSPRELTEFIAEHRVLICATIGPSGRPHLMPLWYVPDGNGLLAWTYAASQKVVNLRRDPRATLQIEVGDTYDELPGVMIEADVELIDHPDRVQEVGVRLALRYGPPELAAAPEPPPDLRAVVERQARKRIVLSFTPTRMVSWDQRKLQ